MEKLEAAGLTRIFELERRLLPIIARMEIHGFAVDTARMREMRETARKRADAIAAGLRAAFGHPKLNPGSPDQLLAAFEAVGVIFTTFLYVSPVQIIPACDHTGTPPHFHSSTTSGAACLMRIRTRASRPANHSAP